MAAMGMPAPETVVVGLGRTGAAVIAHLVGRGERVAAVDSRRAPPALEAVRRHHPEVDVVLGGIEADVLLTGRRVILSPGVDPRLPAIQAARDAGIPVLGEIALFARAANAPVVGITGSNGKSTVTSLLGDMLACAGADAAVGGNLGTPALELLREPPPACYVLELSSFQLETVGDPWAPRAAAILNVSPDHLDRYDRFDDYVEAKGRILHGAETAVLNADDGALRALGARRSGAVHWFSLSAGATVDYRIDGNGPEARLICRGVPRLAVGDLAMQGRHNAANALAACALADVLGVPEAAQREALQRFQGLPHRMEVVLERDGVVWINDSKATNVDAAVAALAGAHRPVVLLAGGRGKGADFASLGEAARHHARAAVVFGEDRERIAACLEGLTVERVETLEEATAMAARYARSGDAVLLAPACASFDQFPDFEARGEAFRRAVAEVAHG